MNQDKNRKTKHYQNSDYPSGSFEAAINADHQDRLNEGVGLRLERHPLAPGNSGPDLEEMVPAFMHRDFFRGEEDAPRVETPTPRLRAARKADSAEARAYQEPPVSEEEPPRPPLTASSPPPQRSVEAPPPAVAAAEAEPLAPLRSGEPASAPAHPGAPPPGPASDPAPATPPAAMASAKASPYSTPMLIALALILAVFVWREQTRPALVGAQPLPVPQLAITPAVEPTAMPEPTPAAAGFRPTYLAVGPAVPDSAAEPTPAPTGGPGEEERDGLFPGEGADAVAARVSEEDAEAADRAAILERVSQTSESAPSGAPGELFPMEEETEPVAPVRPRAEVKPAPKPAPKVAPKAEPVPSAATAVDLFPIDEELPLKPARPKTTAPAVQPAAVVAVPPAQPAADPADGYQIAEPSL